ncbi:MAG: TRAM domain-containing protein [Patescibacteria group bacterium]|nr:TRAM domain-containing protein [Patescibacteria group bacterium]
MAEKLKKTKEIEKIKSEEVHGPLFSPKLVGLIADEVAKTVIKRLPSFRRSKKRKKNKKIKNAIFLDTSAIIDGRIFDVISTGFFSGFFILLESILLELKHIADSQDAVKRERGRRGLVFLEKLKKTKGAKLIVLPDDTIEALKNKKLKEVDERLIHVAHANKGRIITCDYNLEKKASIGGVTAINVNTLATMLKVRAVPGEALHVKILHQGKEASQGVGYLDDGTMIVVENASPDLGKEVDTLVSRVIQTTAGRILFAKKI